MLTFQSERFTITVISVDSLPAFQLQRNHAAGRQRDIWVAASLADLRNTLCAAVGSAGSRSRGIAVRTCSRA